MSDVDFYPRSPCGERRLGPGVGGAQQRISIHALLAESDYFGLFFRRHAAISIHALLAESDALGAVTSSEVSKFLSTLSLRRATLYTSARMSGDRLFLSTLSLRRATRRGVFCYLDNIISIHALLAESDSWHSQHQHEQKNFYPRSPCGERRKVPLLGIK